MNQAALTLKTPLKMTPNADFLWLVKPTSLRDRTDDELMLLARGGRKEAFEVLVERYQKQVLSVAYKKVQNSSMAADVMQNTFLELFRYVPKYRVQGRFSSLLFRIAFNECNQVFRARGYSNKAQDILSQAPSETVDMPDSQLLADECRQEVLCALGKLSEKLRDVLVLRFSADLSYKEISNRLDIPVGTVKSRFAAGIEKMREALEADRSARD